jgi:hypothetical protein
VALVATVAGCDAGTACAGCGFPQFTISDGDAATRTTSAAVSFERHAVSAPAPVLDAGPQQTVAVTPTPREERENATSTPSDDRAGPGYTLIQRNYSSSTEIEPTTAPAGPDVATSAGSAAGAAEAGAASAPAESVTEAPPAVDLVVVPFGGGTAAEVAPKVNVSVETPRSIPYAPPPSGPTH